MIMIIAGILAVAGLAYGFYKYKTKGKKEKDPKTPPFEPLPVPEPKPPVIIEPEPPVIVEPTPEPKPDNILTINFTDDGKDHTKEIRQVISDASEGLTIKFNGRAKTTGMLPEDILKDKGDIGGEKILKIHGKKELTIIGGDFYNPDNLVTSDDGNVGNDVSENSFLGIVDVEELTIKDLTFTGPHFSLRENTGFPNFYHAKEFEHFIDISGGRNVFIKNLKVSHIHGDFIYFRSLTTPSNNYITILDSTLFFNGRQGFAWGYGSNTYIDGCRVELSGRGGADFEPPTASYNVKNVIIKNTYFKTHLLPVPMGGRGVVENILIENTINDTGRPQTVLGGDRVNMIRKNIIFRNNKSLAGFGSPLANYQIEGSENILVEGEETIVSRGREGLVMDLKNSRNVTIRNNDFINGEYINLRDTPIEEVKILGNVQNLKFRVYNYDTPYIDPPNIWDARFWDTHRNRTDLQKWKDELDLWDKYMNERNLTAKITIQEIDQYDVSKYGEPDVPKDPDFIPYMGKDPKDAIDPNRKVIRSQVTTALDQEEAEDVFSSEANLRNYYLSKITTSKDGELTHLPFLIEQFNYQKYGSFNSEYKYLDNGIEHRQTLRLIVNV